MSDLVGKRLLILGGSRISCEIVRKAKEMGVYTMVTDWYPVEDSPAKQIADEYFMVSTTDIKALTQLIKDKQIDGVTTGFTDSVLPHYADICEAAGLPSYGTREQFETLTDKTKYKKLCREYNVPVVEEYAINLEDLNSDKVHALKYPVLVKPADGSGARGVYICNNVSELIKGYNKSLTYSRSKEIIVERYLQGKEVTVFYVIKDGQVYLSGMANRHVKNNQEGIIPLPVAYTFPSIHLEKYMKEVDPNVKEMFKSLGLKDGMVFMQCLIEDGEAIIYDIGYRLTGTLEYKLMEEIYGYNPLEMLIQFALTGNMSDQNLDEIIEAKWSKYACNVSFLIKPGTIHKIKGIEDVLKIPGVIDSVLAHKEGETLTAESVGMLRQIMLRVFATAETEVELKSKLAEIYSSLQVLDENGDNLLLEGLDTNKVRGVLL